MTLYTEQQTGFLMIIPAGIMGLFITWLYAFQLGDRPISTGGYFLVLGILVFMVALLYRLQTTVTDTHVWVRFGVGIIKRAIPVSSIQGVTVVTNAWYYGWGIRIIPRGWLYNINGTKGIELQLKSGRVIRIGSGEPESLQRAIDSVIKKDRPVSDH